MSRGSWQVPTCTSHSRTGACRGWGHLEPPQNTGGEAAVWTHRDCPAEGQRGEAAGDEAPSLPAPDLLVTTLGWLPATGPQDCLPLGTREAAVLSSAGPLGAGGQGWQGQLSFPRRGPQQESGARSAAYSRAAAGASTSIPAGHGKGRSTATRAAGTHRRGHASSGGPGSRRPPSRPSPSFRWPVTLLPAALGALGRPALSSGGGGWGVAREGHCTAALHTSTLGNAARKTRESWPPSQTGGLGTVPGPRPRRPPPHACVCVWSL